MQNRAFTLINALFINSLYSHYVLIIKGVIPIARPPFRPVRKDTGPRINLNITAEEIRVVGADGEMLGVMDVKSAVTLAEEVGLDLVEVSPNAKPPVCKILDFGKYKYEQQKKASEARKKQKTVDVKEVKMRPTIEDHDYGVKLRNAQKFLKAENKVKVTLRFRGREMAHKDLASKLLTRFKDDLADLSKVEMYPKMEGRQMLMILAPDATLAEAAAKEAKEAEKAAKRAEVKAAKEAEAASEAPKDESAEEEKA